LKLRTLRNSEAAVRLTPIRLLVPTARIPCFDSRQ
jgi:hypothetical protein